MSSFRHVISIYDLQHRVDRVLGFFSSRPNWDPPTPSPADECVPHFGSAFSGEGHTACGRGFQTPNSDEGIDAVVL
jgi:hypothetical protein